MGIRSVVVGGRGTKTKADPFGMTTKEARTTAKAKADEFYFAFEQGIV
jgi:hypothetical protein